MGIKFHGFHPAYTLHCIKSMFSDYGYLENNVFTSKIMSKVIFYSLLSLQLVTILLVQLVSLICQGKWVIFYFYAVVSVGVALFFFQQMAGINAVVYYSTAVFRSAGIESDVAASALVGASNVFGKKIVIFPHEIRCMYNFAICKCFNLNGLFQVQLLHLP